MSSVAILNFAGCSNYGANLTAYALIRFCETCGCKAALVNRRFMYFIEGDQTVFYRFGEKYLKWTAPCYGREHFRQLNSCFDSFIVGNDQVWAYQPSWTTQATVPLRDCYDLEFAAPGKRRIAVAASFGSSSYDAAPENFIIARRKAFQRFSSISVREASGVDICRDYFGVQATHILDPVFLLSAREWGELADCGKRALPERYAAICTLHEPYRPLVRKLTEQLASQGLSAEDILSGEEVEDWVNIIRNSELVVTDSFHVTCFAIIFRKPILFMNIESRGGDRVPSLIKMLGLRIPLFTEKAIMGKPEETLERMMQLRYAAPDYATAEPTISACIAAAKRFLGHALSASSPEGVSQFSIDRAALRQEKRAYIQGCLKKLCRLAPRIVYNGVRGIINTSSRRCAKNQAISTFMILRSLAGLASAK